MERANPPRQESRNLEPSHRLKQENVLPGVGKHKGKLFDFDGKEVTKREDKEIVFVQFGDELDRMEIIGLPEGHSFTYYKISPECKDHKDYALGVFGIMCPKCKLVFWVCLIVLVFVGSELYAVIQEV